MKWFQNKLGADIIWTIGSFVILAISGIIMNIVISGVKDASHLGIFNLSYAVYIISSQIAVLGIHYSVLRHIAFFIEDVDNRVNIIYSAKVLALLLGCISAVIIYFGSPFFGYIFNSSGAEKIIQNAAFGLLLFPLNKVLIAYLQGLRRMKAFAILQSCRYITLMGWVVFVCLSNISFNYISIGFFIAELITTIGAIIYLKRFNLLYFSKLNKTWIKRHMSYGGKSLLAGMFVELNSRVDVLLIGVFLPDREVGIYSFASMLVDGLYQLLISVRTNFNPLLISHLRDGHWDTLKVLLKKTKKYMYPITIGLALLILTAFWVLAHYILPHKGLEEGFVLLIILLSGVTLISAFVPFDNLMLVSGFPSFQTLQNILVVTFSIILNLLLIPVFGLKGAAIASASGYIIGIITLIVLAKKKLHWNLVTNHSSVMV